MIFLRNVSYSVHFGISAIVPLSKKIFLRESFIYLSLLLLFSSLSDSGWSADGVSTAMSTTVGNVSTVECASLHLTSFAVLVDVRGVEVSTISLAQDMHVIV